MLFRSVGVNAALVETAACVRLLMDKGIITEEEYVDQLLIVAQEEVDMYEKDLGVRLG